MIRHNKSVKKETCSKEKSVNVKLSDECNKDICYENGTFLKPGTEILGHYRQGCIWTIVVVLDRGMYIHYRLDLDLICPLFSFPLLFRVTDL